MAISKTHHTARTHNPKTELSALQKKVFDEVTSGKAKKVNMPIQDHPAERISCTPKGVVDAGVEAYLINNKVYAASSDFAGRVSWYELPSTDARKIETLRKDLGKAAMSMPESKWSSTAPHFLNGSSSLDVTPKGLMGEGYKAYFFGSEIWLEKTPVVPNAKPQWAKL